MKILQRQIQFRPECSLEGPAKVAEMVSYLVLEAGIHQLHDGC